MSLIQSNFDMVQYSFLYVFIPFFQTILSNTSYQLTLFLQPIVSTTLLFLAPNRPGNVRSEGFWNGWDSRTVAVAISWYGPVGQICNMCGKQATKMLEQC